MVMHFFFSPHTVYSLPFTGSSSSTISFINDSVFVQFSWRQFLFFRLIGWWSSPAFDSNRNFLNYYANYLRWLTEGLSIVLSSLVLQNFISMLFSVSVSFFLLDFLLLFPLFVKCVIVSLTFRRKKGFDALYYKPKSIYYIKICYLLCSPSNHKDKIEGNLAGQATNYVNLYENKKKVFTRRRRNNI